jgi:adenylate cyclase
VTVLFADVVHSMDIAAAVGAERLREIMADLADRCAAVVLRFGGTVDKFTGDGIMAVFGAPVALEDHAIRACLAALDMQKEAQQLAAEVERRDRLDLRLRVGLNSGQVIAGEIGSGSFGYTAVGEQVGKAQRMESVAPPGGVMLSASTARLVEDAAVLGEPEMAHVKGADELVSARRLHSIRAHRGGVGRRVSTLVGREWELAALTAMLDRSVVGHGCVAGVVGPPGIGKSRIVSEVASIAANRGVQVISTFCESHTSEVPFHAVTRLLRAAMGIEGLDDEPARALLRAQAPVADPADFLLLDDALGVGDPTVGLPDIAPDARRRRLTALVNAVALARSTPGVHVIEDAHWIDQVSESLLADLLSVVPQTHSLVLITYRPEYRGVLSRTSGGQTIALAPLDDKQTGALIGELLGSHPSVAGLAAEIAERAAGNPFFAQEMVRGLAERGVLEGDHGGYTCRTDVAEVSVPPTLQSAIAARIDRLGPGAKKTINAAAVIGSRFTPALLAALGIEPVLDGLVRAEMIDQLRFTPYAEYGFHHPLIRTVAYESQLKAARAALHRRLAAAIESGAPESVEENTALIAEHMEAAGDLHAAFAWHMRAATWLTNRDISAAQTSWRRAQQVADRLPADDRDRTAMRIAPRTLLCGSAWRVGGSGADTGFDELRDLCRAAGDQRSLAIGMAGQVMEEYTNARRREASRLASEHIALLESISDPTLMVALSFPALVAKLETGEIAEAVRVAQHVIDLADGDPTMGALILGSPAAIAIAVRGAARWCLGTLGWNDDFQQAVAMARAVDPTTLSGVMYCTYAFAIPYGAVLPDATALRDTADTLALAEQSGDDIAVETARTARGLTLVQRGGPQREAGFDLLAQAREAAMQQRFGKTVVPIVDIHIAKERIRLEELDGAIELSRNVVDELFDSGGSVWSALATAVLVEALLRRGADGDLAEAQAAIDRLAAVPTDRGFVLHDIPLLRLRALLSRARGDEAGYRDYRDRYRKLATELGFEGHIALAGAMT